MVVLILTLVGEEEVVVMITALEVVVMIAAVAEVVEVPMKVLHGDVVVVVGVRLEEE